MAATFKVTKNFFDKPAVVNAIGKAGAKILAKSGAKIRTIAQRSMRYRKNKSAPDGSPPFAHKPRAFLRQFTFFSYDTNTKSVVVGPEKLGAGIPAGKIQEFGGTTKIKNARRKIRKIGDGGEFRIGGKPGKTTKTIAGLNGVTYFVTYGKIKTDEQARRANQLNEFIYGPMFRTVKVAPHPFMAPALKKVEPDLAPMWKNAIVRGR